ncbi:hypothetical protein DSM43518_00491 [Mycobacterium marinum]|uniref:Uncharacterized protein n=1 Tax=Mycobacterium marinum TaxID=1781 RepID=A0A2Z5YC26_MYCMR|nr:hypothetical protein VIMS_04291 [Mycobacterium marinum]CDM75659.1 hypothetical protein MMARE11_15110 [Mycobacterium marinum E11]RFZ12266.1 hypothetical protein DE4381_00807 [Mycobacterium marinum]RFZ14894.1 hypothetical protein DSM43518_00491 [Mycobacterium marinum]RFZ21243.1 hypothetical protein DSM43519_03483 [Mycobacterium marinum]
MRVDTSSEPAANNSVVAAAAAALAALTVDPMFANSPAADDTISGEIDMYDTGQLQNTLGDGSAPAARIDAVGIGKENR